MSLILPYTCSNELWTFAGHKINFGLVIDYLSGTYPKLFLLVTSCCYLFLLRETSYSAENRNKIHTLIPTVVVRTQITQ